MQTKVISNITLDISGKKRDYIVIKAKQGDKSTRFIRATIVNGKEQVAFQDGERVQLNCKRADNIKRTFDGNVEADGKVLFGIPSWALELPYSVSCDVSIIDTNNLKITTATFYIEVVAAAVSEFDTSED